ncbi:hypothetical protein MTR_8g076630 [Medicago truncatula]|uniref:Uncharacterized protein n=1 Tax=Medicago truncatula TaxID=3880 RepID=A0A072TUB9_MEDTR|nr:hypothetical protein MTR_8g076630 [Medicago truncatula]
MATSSIVLKLGSVIDSAWVLGQGSSQKEIFKAKYEGMEKHLDCSLLESPPLASLWWRDSYSLGKVENMERGSILIVLCWSLRHWHLYGGGIHIEKQLKFVMKLVTLIALVEEEDDWRCLDEDQDLIPLVLISSETDS